VTGDLVERLRAELDRREQIAEATSGGPWEHNQYGIESEVWSQTGHRVLLRPPTHHGTGGYNTFGAPDCRFVAANDPAHVLRTIQAHRQILDAHPLAVYTDEEPGYAQVLNDHLCPGSQTPCLTIRALASIYFPEGTEPT